MTFNEIYREIKKANRLVHSAYDNADLDAEAMTKLRAVVEAHDLAADKFVAVFSEMFE